MLRMELRMTGILLLLMPLFIIVSWSGLILSFEYPDILREPVQHILQKYQEAGTALKLYWSGMVVSSLLIFPVVTLLYRATSSANRGLSLTAAAFGNASALFHVLGFSRWLFAVDYLADLYTKQNVSLSQKETIEIMFNVPNKYLSVTVGETLGFMTMGIWAILISIALYQSGLIKYGIAVISILSGIGILTGVLEWIGFSIAVEINAYAYQVWILVIACLGIFFILRSR